MTWRRLCCSESANVSPLAVAVVHQPEILILDEPTSGVDPVARDGFWELLIELSRKDRVTIFISTHFMNEGERCDRISLMHAGRVLVSDTPEGLILTRGAANLEEAFIGYPKKQAEATQKEVVEKPQRQCLPHQEPQELIVAGTFSPMRLFAYTHREAPWS